MATYLKGVTDYIPQVQPWEPDYNFYQGSLERKQSQYNRGWEQTNSIYNSILNAPMMRGQNIERRDQFFKEIESQIQQISGVDLSLAQNVDTASQVFRPFYEDQNIIKDIGFTKKYQKELQNAEYLRTCTDDKCKGKYWDGGVRAMQYRAQEFAGASDEDALRMSAPTYTNSINFMEKATIAVKEAGFKMVRDEVKGGYMVTTTNGEQMIGPLKDFMMSRFGNDQETVAFYNTKAYLLRKENPEAAINAFEMMSLRNKAGSQEELQALVKAKTDKAKFDTAVSTIHAEAKSQKSGLQAMMERKKIIEGVMSDKGVLPGSEEDKKHHELVAGIPIKEQAVEKTQDISTSVQHLSYIDPQGRQIPDSMIDKVVAQAMLLGDIDQTAGVIAFKEYSVKKKADSYALASFKNNLAIKRDAIKAARMSDGNNTKRTIDYIRKAAETGDWQAIQRAKFIDAQIIDKGLSETQALKKYREQFPTHTTGLPYYDGIGKGGPSRGKVSQIESGTSTFLQNSIEAAGAPGADLETGVKAKNDINGAINRIYADSEMNMMNAGIEGARVINPRMKQLLRAALYTPDKNNTIASEGILLIGDALKEQENLNNPAIAELKANGKWDRFFKTFPNSEDRYENGKEVLANINDGDASDLIYDILGPEQMLNILTGDQYLKHMFGSEDSDAFTQINWSIDNANSMQNSINKQLGAVAEEFGESVTVGEEDFIAVHMRKNILKGNGLKYSVASPIDFYKSLATGGVDYLRSYDEGNITTGISPTVLELENDYSTSEQPLKFDGEDLKGLLSTADAQALDLNNLDYRKLAQENGVDLVVQPGMSQRTGVQHTTKPYENLELVWPTLLSDPQTQVQRNKDKVIITSPYFKNGRSRVYDLGDVDTHAGVEDMYNDVQDNFPRVVSSFGDKMQSTGGNPEYLAYGINNFGSQASNFNQSAKAIEGAKMIPNNPIPAYGDFIQLFEEAEANLDADFSPYGLKITQGSKEFLDNALQGMKGSYKKGANMPTFTVGYKPVAGHDDIVQVNIQLDKTGETQDWLKSIGREVSQKTLDYDETGSRIRTTRMSTSGTYYIPKSNSNIIRKSKTDEYTNTFKNLTPDASYVDNSMQNMTGVYTEYKRRGDLVEMTQFFPIYDDRAGKPSYSEVKLGTKPITEGTPWEAIVKNNNRGIYKGINRLYRDYNEQGVLIHNPNQP